MQMAPKMVWVHTGSAGVDHLAGAGLTEKGIKVTSSSGFNSDSIAEYILMYMIMHVKQMTKQIERQRRREWTRLECDGLSGKTLGIVGPGHIGMDLAKRAQAFEMRVLATRRSYKPGEQLPNVDEIYPRDRLHSMLGMSDFVAVAVSLNPETRRMIGEAEFQAMKPGAYFINVSRGQVVDEAALVRTLKCGHLSGAGLDVFEHEPLPPESELWELPNVLITDHHAGIAHDNARRATEVFCRNLQRYLRGEPLENLINPSTGY
jgi:phosphoglycerate dehydrogenase-like enzyme